MLEPFFPYNSVAQHSRQCTEKPGESISPSAFFSQLRDCEDVEPATAGSGDFSESSGAPVLAAKVMRKHDTYIQYTSDAQKEGDRWALSSTSTIHANEEICNQTAGLLWSVYITIADL